MREGKIIGLVFFRWWYSEAIEKLLIYLGNYFYLLYDLFSVKICITTLFDVWRRDRIYYDNLSLQEAFEAWTLNLASRIIGFIVKTSTLIAFLAVASIVGIVALTVLILWVCYPFLIVGFFYMGIRSMIGV